MAEAYALQEGVSLTQHIIGNNFILQSDNSKVTETMKNVGFSATSLADIFDDGNIFEHCNREANEVAHELVRFSFNDHVDQFWDGGPPSFLLSKLMNDVTLFEY
jgi:hypothetical protein